MTNNDREHLKKTSVIFFDAGNTLVTIDFETVAKIITSFGYEADPHKLEELEQKARSLVDCPIVVAATEDTNRWIRHYTVILEGVGVKEEAKQWQILGALKEEHQRLNLWRHVDDSTPTVLEELKQRGYRIALISNADGSIESLMETVGLKRYLEFCIDSAVVGVEKPDPKIFDLALARMGVAAENCVYVGDLYHVDVVGARAAGLIPILLDPASRHSDQGCLRIKSLPELLPLLPSCPTKAVAVSISIAD